MLHAAITRRRGYDVRTLRNALAIVVAALVLLVSRGAASQDADRERASRHFKRGVALVDDGDLDGAAAEFNQAYSVSPHYSVLYNLGLVYAELNRSIEATHALERYLKDGGARVKESRRREVTDKLVELRVRIGWVSVVVQPADSKVVLDGVTVPTDQPVRVVVGTHELVASREGHSPSRRRFSVAGEQHVRVQLTLEAEAAPRAGTGWVRIACAVPGMTVTVNGAVLGVTPIAAPLALPVGQHALSCARPGYRAPSRNFQVSAEATHTIDCGGVQLEELPPAIAATLVIEATEPGTIARVDGAIVGPRTITPVGLHDVEVEREGFQRWRRAVTLAAGARTLHVQLVPTPQYLHDYQQDAQAHRRWAVGLGISGGAVAIVAVAVGVWNDQRFGDAQDEYNVLEGLQPTMASAELDARRAANEAALEAIHDVDKVTVALGVGAGAALVGSMVALATGADPARYDRVVIAPAQGGGSIGWRAVW